MLLHSQGPKSDTPNPKRAYVPAMLRFGLGALCGLAILFVSAQPARAQGPPTGSPHQVTLTWQAPSPVGGSGTIAGYNIYRTLSGPPTYTKINATLVVGLTMVDTTVTAGATYGYCGTTVDSTQHESACTIPISVGVPSNPNPPNAITGVAN